MDSKEEPKEIVQQRLMFEKHLASIKYSVPLRSRARTDIMKKKENKLTRGRLARKGACDRGLYDFEKWYPNGHATLTEVLRKLQILANTALNPLKYVDYAKWLVNNYPPTQEPLVLDELTEKVIFWNGDINIKSGIDGERFIIGNGDLNIEGGVNLNGGAEIWAGETINAENITADGDARIWAERKVKANDITADGDAKIGVGTTIDAENITADAKARIWANETIDATNIAAYGYSGIWAEKINTQNIMQGNGTLIRGEIDIIQPSSNPQNTNTAS